jgi:Zn-dependent peptidase ImmA (M78 family)
VTYNPNILRDVLRARSLTRRQLSERIGIDPTDLESELNRDPEPRQGILNSIARELALPPFIFFMERTPALPDVIPDFRAPNPAPTAKTRQTIEAIQFAEGVQRAAADVDSRGVDRALPRFTAIQRTHVDDFALQVRDFFAISVADQFAADDAREFYILCRKKIEDKGIFVLHGSFPEQDGSGFCLSHDTHPLILINTKQQTRGRRLFTLVHELAHVLMGKTGISDPFVSENTTERLCNRFAGAFLVPEKYVNVLLGTREINRDPDYEDVRKASRRLNISQEATVLRLEQLGIFNAGSHKKWKRIVHNRGNPDFSEKGGGSKPPPQKKVKLAKYGFHFAAVFDPMVRDGRISELNLFRSTGLKPKYQRAYFNYAKSITSSELRDVALDDE